MKNKYFLTVQLLVRRYVGGKELFLKNPTGDHLGDLERNDASGHHRN